MRRRWLRHAQLQLGLVTFGLGGALTLEAGIGVDPWSVFHEALALLGGVTFGTMTVVVGMLFVTINWWWLGIRPGLGTLFNLVLVGPWVDCFRALHSLPRSTGMLGILQFVVGLGLIGLASGAYIAARLGAGPRDSFTLGLSRRFCLSVRSTRIGIEVCILVLGWLLGGPVGLGTLLFAIGIGPLMQLSLRLFRYNDARAPPTSTT